MSILDRVRSSDIPRLERNGFRYGKFTFRYFKPPKKVYSLSILSVNEYFDNDSPSVDLNFTPLIRRNLVVLERDDCFDVRVLHSGVQFILNCDDKFYFPAVDRYSPLKTYVLYPGILTSLPGFFVNVHLDGVKHLVARDRFPKFWEGFVDRVTRFFLKNGALVRKEKDCIYIYYRGLYFCMRVNPI